MTFSPTINFLSQMKLIRIIRKALFFSGLLGGWLTALLGAIATALGIGAEVGLQVYSHLLWVKESPTLLPDLLSQIPYSPSGDSVIATAKYIWLHVYHSDLLLWNTYADWLTLGGVAAFVASVALIVALSRHGFSQEK